MTEKCFACVVHLTFLFSGKKTQKSMNIQIEHESKVFLYHINIFYTTACENRPHSSEIASAKKKTKMNAGRKNLLSNSTHGME